MKILHLSTSVTGGAAVTANSLARIQRKFGHESTVFTREEDLSPISKLKSGISTFISLTNATSEYVQVTHFSASGISLKKIWDLNPEVIFIHNWFNFLSEEQMVTITNRFPTIFVAHDARLATGGCHVNLGCQNFRVACTPCPAAHIDKFASMAKKSIDSMVDQLGKYAIVTPSNWLMDEILESPIIQRAAVTSTIGNPAAVDLNIEIKTKSHDQKIFRILFVAAALDAKYKGFNLFLEAISNLEMTEIMEHEIEVQIVGVGGSKILPTTDSRVKIIFKGALSPTEVHQLMAESDLLVVSSLTENYPGVIAEAQLLGCAVAASKVGGIPEMVEDGISGFLFEPNESACKNAIIRAINSPNRMQIVDLAREIARARYDEGKINRKFEKLIENLLRS